MILLADEIAKRQDVGLEKVGRYFSFTHFLVAKTIFKTPIK